MHRLICALVWPKLNDLRADVFGNIETVLLSTERVTTEHNCTPRDLVAIGNQFIFGYNVQFGLKSEIGLADVFSAYQFSDHAFHAQGLDLIGDERFVSDFHELYRFYKDTRFSRFFRSGPMVHMVFQVGKTPKDIKSFKWRVGEDRLEYIDNRSEHEVKDPPQHEFRWVRTTRDQHHYGSHPHISIEDLVFVETVGGDLTIKVENNTDSGEGIYAEPVDNPDQTLDDAEIHYAVVGNLVLLKIRPYQELQDRFFVFNGKIQQAMRLDEIEHSCVMLPGGSRAHLSWRILLADRVSTSGLTTGYAGCVTNVPWRLLMAKTFCISSTIRSQVRTSSCDTT